MFRTGAINSAIVAAGSTVLAVVSGSMAAFALVRYRFPGRGALGAFFLSPLIMPKVAVGIAMFILFVRLNVFGTTPSLMIAHAALTVPFVISVLSAQLVGLDRTLEEAAEDLGAPPWLTFLRVVLPQLTVGLVVASLFALITSFDETEASIFLYRPANITLPIAMFIYLEQRQDPTVAALSTLFILMTLLPVLLALPVLRGGEVRRILERR
jgi:putative spermidine/putrescine transport system permease protein